MTFRVPSAFAAFTRASIPPRAWAEVAVAALAPPPEVPEVPVPPPLEPQAVRARPAVTTTTAARRVLLRTCPPVVVPRRASAPCDPEQAARPIVADSGRQGSSLYTNVI